MLWLQSLLATLLLAARSAEAVFVDEAGVVDWHHVLVGAPRRDATFLHRPSPDSRASLIYTLTEKNIIAAVNPKDGAVVWRQHISDHQHDHASFRSGQDSAVVVSALGAEVAAWGASDGRQLWSVDFGAQAVRDLEIIEVETGKQVVTEKDSLVLVNGTANTVYRLSGVNGRKLWEYKDSTGDIAHQVSASATTLFYVALQSTGLGGGYKIKVTTLDPTNGERTNQYTLNSDGDVFNPSQILTVGANSASPIIVWTNKDYTLMKVSVLGSNSIAVFPIEGQGSPVEEVLIHAPSHSNSRPHFLVSFTTAEKSWAQVYHIELRLAAVSKAYDLPRLSGPSSFAITEDGANVYFSRINQDRISVYSSETHGVLNKWSVPSSLAQSQPLHAVTELSLRGSDVTASRTAVFWSNGEWSLLRNDQLAWTRQEALASTVAAVFAYQLNTDQHVLEEVNKEAELDLVGAYVHRWKRHFNDLQSLPALLASIPQHILSSVGLESKDAATLRTATNSFGYHKIVVCVTSSGQIIGLDAGDEGKTIWSFALEDGLAVVPGVIPVLSAQPDGTVVYKPIPEATGSLIFDASTGATIDPTTFASGALSRLQVETANGGIQASLQAEEYWRFIFPADEQVISVVSRPVDEPIASIGRVLGDRKVLYKYINPNLLLVTTTPASRSSLSVHLLDSLTGEELYTSTHDGVASSTPFSAVVSENWFAYSFVAGGSDADNKGAVLVVGDLYESLTPDDRGPSTNGTDRFPLSRPYIPVQSWAVTEPISQLAVTQTGQGITSKNLLAILPSSRSIVSIPRPFIDPRRPVNRDPTKDEQFEGLMRYTPTLEFDPRWYLTHQREVFGLQNVTTSPAILESTSLVFAYGLDAFGTRVSPSGGFDVLGKSFNKLQMLATVFVLGVGTVAVAPLVARKGVNGRWTMVS